MKKSATNFKVIAVVGSLVLLSAFAFSVRNDEKGSSAEANYTKYCSGCHGKNLDKFAARQWMDDRKNTRAIKGIRDGLETSGMPAFGNTFSEKEIRELAAYVKKWVPRDKSKLTPALTTDRINKSKVRNFVVDTVVSGLKVPWGLAFLPDGDMLISERSGVLYRYSEKGKLQKVEGVPDVFANGQGGLLDIALHPAYAENGWIYFTYSAPEKDKNSKKANTALMRAKIDGYRLTDQQIIFRGEPLTERTYHFGSKIAFDNKGHIFFGIGDRGQHFDFPQKTDNSNGKIHRINDDGTIPADNPFFNVPGAMKSVYSYGHRNPQGTVVDPVTGIVWATEHGPKGGDELNIIKPGINYGWPVISYGINYDGTILTELKEKEGMEQPVYQWTPSIGPCGMTFVTGNKYPEWKNNLLIGSLAFQYLERVVLVNNKVAETEKLLEGIGRVRNVVMGPDGYVYVAIELPGKILRLTPVE